MIGSAAEFVVRRPRRWSWLALAAWMAACAPSVSTRSFELVATPDANRRSPIPVDVVLVRSDALVPVVTGLSAREWFTQRDQLVRDHPRDLEFRSWEMVPGQVLEIDDFHFPSRKGLALVVFADYMSGGVHRLRVDPMREFRLVLDANGFEAEATR